MKGNDKHFAIMKKTILSLALLLSMVATGAVAQSKVYLTREISPQALVKIYKALGVPAKGRVAVKVSTGEGSNPNYLKPELIKDLVYEVDGTIVENNTAYGGDPNDVRNNTANHWKVIERHGFTKYFPVDILDEYDEIRIPVRDHSHLNYDIVGGHLANYDFMIALNHFKGHPMGGYGGALKQLSIGFASSYGKAYIHGVGVPEDIWTSDHDSFLESMADAAASVIRQFPGQAAYINVMANLSVDCDCCAVAEDPCMKDIGILASLDPVAIDQACLDLVYAATQDPGQAHLLKRIESRNGVHTIEAAAALGIGSRDYTLIEI